MIFKYLKTGSIHYVKHILILLFGTIYSKLKKHICMEDLLQFKMGNVLVFHWTLLGYMKNHWRHYSQIYMSCVRIKR